jgi:anti-anti-sigma factor
VEEITVSQDDTIDVIEARGGLDMSNVDALNGALKTALSDDTTSCVLDLSELDFVDSSVIHTIVRWSKDVQLSQHEALAILVGRETPAAQLVNLAGLNDHRPIFSSRDGAKTALLEGQRARDKRRLEWLTDAELRTARTDAQTASDAAGHRLEDITAEEERRRDQPPSP